MPECHTIKRTGHEGEGKTWRWSIAGIFAKFVARVMAVRANTPCTCEHVGRAAVLKSELQWEWSDVDQSVQSGDAPVPMLDGTRDGFERAKLVWSPINMVRGERGSSTSCANLSPVV